MLIQRKYHVFLILIGTPLFVVELAGKAIEVIGEVTDSDAR